MMSHFAAILVRLVLPVAKWIARNLEDGMSKETDALADLDKAIDSLEAWRNADDENDAGAITVRTARINELMNPTPGEVVDSATGNVVQQGDPAQA